MSVERQSSDAAANCAKLPKVRALMGGTDAMRATGERYLPRMEAETVPDHRARLAQSTLFNGLAKAVHDMAGRVFAKPIAIGDDVPPELQLWAENIDLAGRHLSNFAADLMRDGLTTGGAFILVDAPARDGNETRATTGLRPYLKHLTAEAVLGWRAENIDGAVTLTQFRFIETIAEPDGEFGEAHVEQITVFDRLPGSVMVRLFRKIKDKWGLHGEPGFTGLAEITVVPFYARRTGFCTFRPPLEDLADVNIAHWQSQSDQRHILHVARVPVLVLSGISDEDKIVIGGSSAITTSDPAAKVYWAEVTGASIAAGRADLEALEMQMEALGLQLLVPRANGQSATGESLDAAKETSQLGEIADNLKDALEQAFVWLAEYGGLPQGGSLIIHKDFDAGAFDAPELDALIKSMMAGVISKETLISEFKRRRVLADDLDPADEAERVSGEGWTDPNAEPAVVNE